MTNSENSLEKMPNVVLIGILEKLDFLSVLSLRKVSHRFHNFLDDFPVEKRLLEMKIEIQENRLNLEIQLADFRKINIDYLEHKNGCIVARKFLKNADISTVFSKDFEIISNLQRNSKLSYFKLVCNCEEKNLKILVEISRILESRIHPLKVEYLEFQVQNEDQILKILPFIDPKPVEYLKISKSGLQKFDLLKIPKILEQENFKNLQGNLHICKVSGRIQDFLHFSRITVEFDGISVDDFVDLKEKFLTTPHLECVDVRLSTQMENWQFSEILEHFGPTFDDLNYMGSRRKRWFFKNGITVLSIDFTTREMQFLRIPEDTVPGNARIMLQ